MSKRVAVVTGSGGFVGRHMAVALRARGYAVLPFELTDGNDALRFFAESEVRVDLMVHCAAHVGGRVDIDGKPLCIGATNLELDAAMFRWALRTRPGRVVYFSSSAAYPVALQQDRCGPTRLIESDIKLEDPMPADASYGLVKLVGEQLAEMAEAEGIRTHVFRPFSGYGPDQSLDYPFPSFAQRARERRQPFELWGDGTAVRDWVHISDVVGGVLACIDADVPGPVNLCTGVPTSFDELAAMFSAAAGYNPDLEHVLDAPRGVAYRVGDPTKLHEVYVPKVSVERGVAEAVAAERRAA